MTVGVTVRVTVRVTVVAAVAAGRSSSNGSRVLGTAGTAYGVLGTGYRDHIMIPWTGWRRHSTIYIYIIYIIYYHIREH